MAEYPHPSMAWVRLNHSLPPRHPWLDRIHYHDSVTSTNDLAKEMAENGAPHGTVVLADTQTGGRGRMGRSFYSPDTNGIYMSLILRPDCRPTELMHLTCAVAAAVQKAICQHVGKNRPRPICEIKWPNDLVICRTKVGGILTEMSLDSKSGLVRYVIIGIGLNCYGNSVDFPPEIRKTAGSISMYHPQCHSFDLFGLILLNLEEMSRKLLTDKAAIMERYRHECMTIGQEVSIHQFDQVRHGTAIGVNDDGGLLVRFDDGHTEIVSAGEVSIRGMYGYV